MKKLYTSLFSPALVLSALGILVSTEAGAIDVATDTRYAWFENAGWASFKEDAGAVSVYPDHLEGYAWAENVGWVRFGSQTSGAAHTYANDSASDWGVNVAGDGTLSGYAWSENAGWINFGSAEGQARIDTATGKFFGYGWSENLGWLHLGADNVDLYGIQLESGFIKEQIITFGALPDKVSGDPDFAINATSSSGLDVQFAASGACTVSDTGHSTALVQLAGIGNCTITATQPGNAEYDPAIPVSQSFFIQMDLNVVLYGGVWTGSQYVVVGDSGLVMTSVDGSTWVEQATNYQGTIYDVIWTGEMFVAVASDGLVLTSADGMTWTSHQVSFGGVAVPIYAIAWSGSRFVAVSQQGYLLTSTDAVNWTALPRLSNNWLLDVTWANGVFVAVGINGEVQTSADGMNWSRRTSGVGGQLEAVTWGTPGFVAVGGVSMVAIKSTNGTTWTAYEEFFGPWLKDVVWLGDRYIAAGVDSAVLTSTDGVTWEELNREAGAPTIFDIVVSGDKVLLIGEGGVIFSGTLANPIGGCNGDTVTVSDRVYHSGEAVLCEATVELKTQGLVQVSDGAAVEYRSPVVRLQPGFVAEAGSSFRAVARSVTLRTTRMLYSDPTVLAQRAEKGADSPESSSSAAYPQRVARENLPAGLRSLLDRYGAETGDIEADGSRTRFVFATTASMMAVDDNADSDVYLYRSDTDSLELISQNIRGIAATGASVRPRIDGAGALIAFGSTADDLIAEDGNGRSDVFTYDVDAGYMQCVSDCSAEGQSDAEDPSLSGDGGWLVYEQQDTAGGGVIMQLETAWPDLSRAVLASPEGTDLTLASANPALDPAGRYLVYFQTVVDPVGNGVGECLVVWGDRTSGDIVSEACPDEGFAAFDPQPRFAEDAGMVEWRMVLDDGKDAFVEMPNPLVE